MMSIAKAMAELLVVMLSGRMKWQDNVCRFRLFVGLHVGREELSVVSMFDKVGGRHVDSDQSCWSRWSSNSEKKKMLFWIVNTFFDLDIVINNDGDVDRGDVVYQGRFKDGDDGEGGCHGADSRHVVNSVCV
jgi:hypothetical protein